MIPVKDGLTNTDTLPGEEIKFGIGDPRWMMRSAAKLYSDVTTAIIREYSTNAHDANIMAGNLDPIQVTLPSLMNPFFTVEDEGVGMDIEDFRQIYTQFGISDKRDLSDANGLMGFGSKSGVAYTTQFTVTSVKNGTKISGVVMRKPDWEIVLKIVSTVKTDEPNGTIISVPVHNVEEFVHKANEFYKFWLPGRVLVNGKEPVHHVGEQIVDGLYFAQGWNQSYVVMGNVAYRINNPAALFRNTKMNQINFVAYVDGGEVEFTPSREDLEYTEHTKATLQKIVNDFEAKILLTAKADIAAANTHSEAYKAWTKWTDLLGKNLFSDLEFKGDRFVSDFNVKGTRYYPKAYRGNMITHINQWNVESSHNTIFVTEFDVNVSSRHKAMVKEAAKIKGWDFTYVVFTASSKDDVKCAWIEKDKFLTYDELKVLVPTVRKTPSSRNYYNPNAGRIPGSWDYFTAAGRETEKPIPVVEDGGELFYVDLWREKGINVTEMLNQLGDTKSVVIKVPANRIAKFKRENPTVKEFYAHARSKVVKDAPSLLSDEAKRALNVHYDTRQWLNSLDLTRLLDPNLGKVRALVKNEAELTKAYEANNALARACRMWYDVKTYEASETSDSIYDKYPLLRRLNRFNFDEDVYLYMNAKHLAETE